MKNEINLAEWCRIFSICCTMLKEQKLCQNAIYEVSYHFLNAIGLLINKLLSISRYEFRIEVDEGAT